MAKIVSWTAMRSPTPMGYHPSTCARGGLSGAERQGRALGWLSLACILTAAAITGLAAERAADANVLATIRIPTTVMANGTLLPAGTYDVRLTQDQPVPHAGQSRDAERWVEFVADGKVIAREIAEVLRDDDLPAIGASSLPVRSGTRVEMLKGGEFLRISVKRDRERFLIYLPVMSPAEG